MRKTIAVALLGLTLAGCTAPNPQPDQPTTYQPPSPSTSNATDYGSVPALLDPAALAAWQPLWADMTCTEPSDEMLTAYYSVGGRENPEFSSKQYEYAQVDIGEGGYPGEVWSVVAERIIPEKGTPSVLAQIMNHDSPIKNPAKGEQWISFGAHDVGAIDADLYVALGKTGYLNGDTWIRATLPSYGAVNAWWDWYMASWPPQQRFMGAAAYAFALQCVGVEY